MTKRLCLHCDKPLEGGSPKKKYCNKSCKDKRHRILHLAKKRDQSKVRSKRFYTKAKIGIEIKNKVLGNPAKTTKSLWDGIGLWSRKYNACLECDTTIYKHAGGGLCVPCYYRLRRDADPEIKKRQKMKLRKNQDKKRAETLSESRKWVDKALNKEIPIDSTIENLLRHL